jgi:predicted DNA-binding antitoxin AbrB/MazE fold protein
MTHHVDAIYDNRVLKPLEPLILPDQTRVKVTVESAEINPAENEILSQQQDALKELWAELDKLPQHKNSAGWSVRDHDRLLYDELQQ